MSSSPIRFYHHGQIHRVTDVSPTRTLLEELRESLHCTGTKEGCAEGDCGACTVVVASLANEATPVAAGVVRRAGLDLVAVNACIRLLPTMDGKAVITVEDLAQDRQLHPVQKAMVECHGSQCGFCTPGFVMSLWQCYEHGQVSGKPATRQEVADALAGNLCRCTGYRPILDAGERMFATGGTDLDLEPVRAALEAVSHESGTASQAPDFSDGQSHCHAPRTLMELATLRARLPQARMVAGATDVGLWITKQYRHLGDMILVANVRELAAIKTLNDGSLFIGAGASLESAWSALAARWPELTEVWKRFASPPIRNAGTLGGNVANGSPIGDGPPVLIALDASIRLGSLDAEGQYHVRELPLAAFYLDYMKNALAPGEFVESLVVPAPTPGQMLRAFKVSKRYDSDISAVCGAFSLRLEGGIVRDARFAFGGMAATVRRAALAEQAVTGHPWDEAHARLAEAAIAQDFHPLSDLRASAAYRSQVAGRLLRRLWLETRPENPLETNATSVWASMGALRVPAGGVRS